MKHPFRSAGEHRRRFSSRISLAAAPLLLLTAFSIPAITSPASAGATLVRPWYVSLGDSLSQGVEPDSTGTDQITNNGYADDLYAAEQPYYTNLQLLKLGCPGETTTSMIVGGICPYTAGSQLTQAVVFLRHHYVAFVTIDIGANDITPCLAATNVQLCVQTTLATTVVPNLEYILSKLKAASPRTHFYAMNYYDPYLVAWLNPGGALGQAEAMATEQLTEAVNIVLQSVYTNPAFAVKVANVQYAFQTADFDLVSGLGIPLNVVYICAYTFMCDAPPVGPNIHANDAGYQLIANTFQALNSTRL